MRKPAIAIALIAAALVAALWWWPGAESGEDLAGAGGETATAAPSTRGTTASAGHPDEADSDLDTAREPGDAGLTAWGSSRAEDGVLEVKVQAADKPVPGALVRLYWRGLRDPNTNAIDWRAAGSGATGEDGLVRLPARPGSYLVAARADGFATARREVLRPLLEKLTRASLSLERGSALVGRTQVKGRAEPVPLTELVLTAEGPTPGEPWRRIDAPAEERVVAMSDARGQFRIEGLAAGAWRVEARAVGYGKTAHRGVVVPRAAELLLELAPAGTLEGFVVGSDGSAAAGASVSVAGGEEEVVVTTGQGGGFAAEVGQGSFTLSARRGSETGSLPNPVTVAVGGAVRGLTIHLGAGCGIEGTVVAKATGAPVAGAAVDVSPHKKTGDSGRAVSDAAGAFEVTGLPPGSYDVVVTAAGFARLERRGVTVSAGQRFSLKLELGGTGAVEGTVKDEQGRPIAGAPVRAGNRWGGASGQSPDARTDGQGRFRLGELEAGKVIVQARREDATLGAVKVVDVVEGQTTQTEVVLADSGFVTGTVTRKSGGPIGGPARVRVSGRRSARSGATPTDSTFVPVEASGRYQVSLPAGRWSLSATVDRPGGGFNPAANVEVEAGKTQHVDLVINDEQAEAVAGVVFEPGGAPSPRAEVSLSVGSGGGQHRTRMTSVAGEEGRFQFSLQPGFAGQPLSVRARNGGRSSEWVTVGADPKDLRLALRPAAALGGRVLPGGGGPITSFTVETSVVETGAPFFYRGRNETLEFTGDRFELHDVHPDQLKIVVTTPDGRTGAAEVTLSPGVRGEVTVTLQQGASVSGVVVSSEGRRPVSDAVIRIDRSHAAFARAGVGADGQFRFSDLAAGEHTLQAWAPLHRATTKKVTLAVGQVLDLGELVLTKNKAHPGSIGAYFEMSGAQVQVRSVSPESPAEAAGLREGDVVLAIDGAPVQSSGDAAVRAQGAAGSTVSFTIRRGTQQKTLQITRAS